MNDHPITFAILGVVLLVSGFAIFEAAQQTRLKGVPDTDMSDGLQEYYEIHRFIDVHYVFIGILLVSASLVSFILARRKSPLGQ